MKAKIILFLIVGIGLLSYGLYTIGSQWRFYHHGVATTGVITGVAQQIEGKYQFIRHPISAHQQSYPMITFETQNNQQITFIGQKTINAQNHFQLGEYVPVIYLPDSPRIAEINNKYMILLLPVSATIVGIFMLILASSMQSRYQLQRVLKSQGKKIMADFVGFKASKEVQNDVQGMVLVCQYKFMSNQPPMKFFSAPIFKKNLVIKKKKIPVYFDSTDRRKYYVDVDKVYESDP